jgi:hypothetical protein
MTAPRLAFLAALSLAATGCNGPTDPSGAGYTGEWSGMTAQGKPISFTISASEAVTTITVGHEFNGCSGTQTFSSLNIGIKPDVQCIPGPCPASIQSYRAFGYAAGDRLEGPSTDINGLFPSTVRAEGLVNFRLYPGCGSAIGVAWTATKR